MRYSNSFSLRKYKMLHWAYSHSYIPLGNCLHYNFFFPLLPHPILWKEKAIQCRRRIMIRARRRRRRTLLDFSLAFMEFSDATQSNCNAQRQFSSSSPFQWLLNKFHLQFSHEKSYNMSSRRHHCCKCRNSVLDFLFLTHFQFISCSMSDKIYLIAFN